MIDSKKKYLYYLYCDKIALGKAEKKRPRIIHDEIWKFERLLRKVEYYKNCRNDIIGKIYGAFLQLKYYRLRLKRNTYIPLNTFGPGLSIAHFGAIVVNGNARIGNNCRIQDSVTIGATNGSSKAPILGNNVFIGSGARIIGNISIADDVAVGANATVVKNVFEKGITVGGVPSKKISDNNSHDNLCKDLEKFDLLLFEKNALS